jgi:hypothetical protein
MRVWTWAETLHPDDAERARRAWEAALTTGSECEVEFLFDRIAPASGSTTGRRGRPIGRRTLRAGGLGVKNKLAIVFDPANAARADRTSVAERIAPELGMQRRGLDDAAAALDWLSGRGED